jgi:outer membrane cobalamin receptor
LLEDDPRVRKPRRQQTTVSGTSETGVNSLFQTAAIVLLLPPSAGAQGEPGSSAEDDPQRTVVEPTRTDPLDAQRQLDARSPGFATAVDLDHEPGARPDDTLAEVVARTPGAYARSIGGLGQWSAVSLRGSAANQVAVFLDGVPLGSSFAGLVDLSDFPLDGIGRASRSTAATCPSRSAGPRSAARSTS